MLYKSFLLPHYKVVLFQQGLIAYTTFQFHQESILHNTVNTITLVESKTIPLLDIAVFFILAGSLIGLIIASIYIDMPPAMVGIFLIGWVVTIFLSGIVSNIYSDVSSNPELSTTANQFTKTNFIAGQYLPTILFVVGIIVIIILYSKTRSGGGKEV